MCSVEYAVIAVAGLGSRLGLGKPKCLVEIEGHPIIHYQLELLKDVPNIRLVVGFEEHEVFQVVKKIRPDVVFVRNPSFRSTTTLDSYSIGANYVDKQCLFMDGDIIFEPNSFQKFLDDCATENMLVGITKAKTDDAVYALLDNENGKINRFSRTEKSDYEWANIVWVPPNYFISKNSAVYEFLQDDLPLPACVVNSYEVDTVTDFERAKAYVNSLAK